MTQPPTPTPTPTEGATLGQDEITREYAEAVWRRFHPNQRHCRGSARRGMYIHFCGRVVAETDYCADHAEQGEYEREIQHAYAAHTAV